MPRCRKTSLEKRRRDQRNAQIKYREKHGDFVRERNRQLMALRRTNEEYRIEERSKCRKAMRKKRYCEQMKKKVELRKQEYQVKNEFDDSIPACNESERNREHELSYSIINGYGYNEHNSFPKLENYYLQEDFQSETCGMIEQSYKQHPIDLCVNNAEFCMPMPVKKFIKFNPNAVKRGRGRPRKDSLASNISNPHNSSFLEEDLQCSTDDDEDGFQEVSEDENNPASFLDQGERIHSMSTGGGSEGGSDLIDAAHIKTEMKIEPTHLGGDDSMDLDPNYDPSEFLTMHSRMANNETNQQQQDNKMSQFLPHEERQGENIQTTQHDNNTNIHQMPLMMGSNDNMGIHDDLAISESDEEDDGNVRVKRELFTDQLDDDQEQQQMQQQQSMTNMQMQQQEQLPIQPYVDIDASKEDFQQQQPQHHQPQTQPSSHHDDNNDDDWLRF